MEHPRDLHVPALRSVSSPHSLAGDQAHLQKTLATTALLSSAFNTPSFFRHSLLTKAVSARSSRVPARLDSQPADEVELHPAAIVDPFPVPPALAEVHRKLARVILREAGDKGVQLGRLLRAAPGSARARWGSRGGGTCCCYSVVERLEGWVPEARLAVVDWWGRFDDCLDLVKHGEDRVDGLRSHKVSYAAEEVGARGTSARKTGESNRRA